MALILLLSAQCFVAALAGPASATILFQESFHAIPAGDVLSSTTNLQYNSLVAHGWDFVVPNCNGYCSMSIVPDPFGSSGNVMRYEYQSDQDLEGLPQQDAHNANLIKLFTPTVYDLWGRVYFATDVDLLGCPTCATSRWFCCGEKLHYLKPVAPGPSYITGGETGEFIPTPVPPGAPVSIGVQEMAVCPQGGTPVYKGGGGCNLNNQNTSTPVVVLDKRWYCFVYHVKINSSYTSADGQIEMWINGSKVLDEQNQLMVDGFYTLANAGIGQIEVYRQHSNHMLRYERDLVWATTQAEVACGSTPQNPTIPAAPGGLRVQ